MPDSSLWQRLKDRKIVQWGLAYLAGAWVVVESASLVAQQFHWPEVVGPVVTILAMFGFFVVLVIAWYHGEKGQQWVSGPELLIIALLLLISGGVLSMLGGSGSSRGSAVEQAPATAGDLAPSAGDPTPSAGGLNDERPVVAVLPFRSLSSDPEHAYFADGQQDEIISKLSKISGLKVISGTSVEQYREVRPPIPQIAAELGGVDFVLEGSARMAGDQVRLIAQLIDAGKEGHLWSEEFTRTLTTENLFAVQTEIAEQIARSMRVVIRPEEETRIEASLTDDLEAYDLYLLGRHRWRTRSVETIREAIGYFEAAIDRDSMFALAYGGIADALMVLPFYDLDVETLDVYEPAKAAALRALELNSALGEIHASLGYLAHTYEWEWSTAERHLLRAIELSPNYAAAHQWHSTVLELLGRDDEALEQMEIAFSLDPMSNVMAWGMAGRLYNAGRGIEARTYSEKIRQAEPSIPWALADYAADLLKQEPVDSTMAREVYAEFFSFFGYPDPTRAADALVAIGEYADSMSIYLALMDDVADRTALDRTDLLFYYLPPVPADVFFDVLEEAVAHHHMWVPSVPEVIGRYHTDLMNHPRWEEFIQRIQYPGSLK